MLNNKLYFKSFLTLTILYILFQIKPGTSVTGNIYYGDDNCYYGYVSSMVNDFDFDLSNNKAIDYYVVSPVTGKIIPRHPIGTSILLMPFYLAAKPVVCFINWVTATPFNQRHILFFMFMCSGIILYSYLGGYFLLKALSALGFNNRISLMSVIAIIWGTILPVYIFKRPIFTHVPEFFLISLFIYLIVKWKDNNFIGLKQLFIISIVLGGILITRWNDVHILFFAIYYLFMNKSYSPGFNKKMFLTLLCIIVVFLVFMFTQGVAWKSLSGSYFTLPYNPVIASETRKLSELFSLSSIPIFFHIFIGLDWGILYTMLPYTLGLIGFLWLAPLAISKWRKLDRIAYLFIFSLPFIIVLKSGHQGGYYGYRHLLSLLPFTCVGLAAFLDKINKRFPHHQKLIWLFIAIILIFNFLLMLPLERTADLTTLKYRKSVMGGVNWVNNFYVGNAVKIYFTSPIKTIIGMFARNFLGEYVLGGVYLLFPKVFLKITNKYGEASYYALDSFDKWIILLYPFLVILMLTIFYYWTNKKIIQQQKEI